MYNYVDLISFLRNYYGISNNQLYNTRLYHNDIKRLFPNIKRLSWDYAEKNHDLFLMGEIVLVYDANNNILPYTNPHQIVVESEVITNSYVPKNDYINIMNLNLDGYSKDELLHLRDKLKKNGQRGDEFYITNIIRHKRDKNVINYKNKRKVLKMEEENEKY